MINGEKAAYASPTFSNRRQRTLDSLITRLLHDHLHEVRNASITPSVRPSIPLFVVRRPSIRPFVRPSSIRSLVPLCVRPSLRHMSVVCSSARLSVRRPFVHWSLSASVHPCAICPSSVCPSVHAFTGPSVRPSIPATFVRRPFIPPSTNKNVLICPCYTETQRTEIVERRASGHVPSGSSERCRARTTVPAAGTGAHVTNQLRPYPVPSPARTFFDTIISLCCFSR